jgi:hypothetical protein
VALAAAPPLPAPPAAAVIVVSSAMEVRFLAAGGSGQILRLVSAQLITGFF